MKHLIFYTTTIFSIFIFATQVLAVSTYEYDEEGRLSKECLDDTYGPTCKTYTYDAYGNKLYEEETRLDYKKNLTRLVVEYDTHGNAISELNYSAGATEPYYIGKTVYKYDDKGNITYHADYFDSDEASNEYWYTHQYDASGNIISELTFYTDINDINSQPGHETKYTYDEKGNMTSIVHYDLFNEYLRDYDGNIIPYGDTRMEYDSHNNPTHQSVYYNGHTSPDEEQWYEYQYDADGNMISKAYRYPWDGKDPSTKVKYIYDDKGNLLREEYYYYGSDEAGYIKEYKYDEYGNITESYTNGELTESYTWTDKTWKLGIKTITSETGAIFTYGKDGSFKKMSGKKIYTVEEAMEATKNGERFHVGLTYK